MATHLVTFATEEFSRSRALCISSALLHGVTQNHPCDPSVLPPDMLRRCEGKRGFGWWQWKPAVIQLAMRGCEDGSVLIYSDIGIEFINNVNYIIDRMGESDIWLFGNSWKHAHWCKRDIVDEVWPYTIDESAPVCDISVPDYYEWATWSRFDKQCQASVIFFRVSDYSKQFVAEWLKWCLFEGGRLIDDSPSRAPNHPEFRENRHDQAILTTLADREGIKKHWWPAVYNRGGSPEFVYEKLPEYVGDNYPVLFSHHRRRDREWENVV